MLPNYFKNSREIRDWRLGLSWGERMAKFRERGQIVRFGGIAAVLGFGSSHNRHWFELRRWPSGNRHNLRATRT
jgi:hypothetical protein